jgi:serine/threonine protein kinase
MVPGEPDLRTSYGSFHRTGWNPFDVRQLAADAATCSTRDEGFVMTASAPTSANIYTLSQRLSEGEIPAAEALRYGTAIAEALRELHDQGRIHGWLTPSAVSITATGIKLLDGPNGSEGGRNYTAPEVLAGNPPDARSDVFSLGALLCAMLAGSRPFAGDGEAGPNPAPSPLLSAAWGHFLNTCMAHDPAERPQRMQKVLLELKFLMLGARRVEAQSATAVVRELSRAMDALGRRLVDAEQEIEELRRYSAVLEEKVTTTLQSHEQTLHAHAASIESVQNSADQTDNLVERVVDALDLLQSTLIEQSTVQSS